MEGSPGRQDHIPSPRVTATQRDTVTNTPLPHAVRVKGEACRHNSVHEQNVDVHVRGGISGNKRKGQLPRETRTVQGAVTRPGLAQAEGFTDVCVGELRTFPGTDHQGADPNNSQH